MKILLAPNAFKGTLSAFEATQILSDFFRDRYPEAILQSIPIGDGGDGTCQLLTDHLGLQQVGCWSLDALGRPIYAYYGLDKDSSTIYLDVSSASGIAVLKKEELNPHVASTYGTGLLINDALKFGINRVILGLGGSASIDLGLGILQGLGFVFLDRMGKEIIPFSDRLLSSIAHIQRSPKIPSLTFDFLCDVDNRFFGEDGAIPVFGPQKGLDIQNVNEFERNAKNAVDLIYSKSKRTFLDNPGFGAAGGIALGISSFFPAQINYGARFFFEQVDMEESVAEADLIITGEGRFDGQSLSGKGCFELLKLAQKYSKSVFIITSGKEAEKFDFQKVIRLPDLDFSQPDFKKIAKKKFIETIEKEIEI
ncbi:MAG: glycerate kinase [Algoriphagus sp.]|uniref:glycerate kinase n=1 Tax=Algoriphagus sp. TaxID=1872435 RepID=UPI0017BE3182|nr:glycerate kinase [Algoriphagus sp.]NVJ86134.1 glycerate kinase [Algoriphagus sp.]